MLKNISIRFSFKLIVFTFFVLLSFSSEILAQETGSKVCIKAQLSRGNNIRIRRRVVELGTPCPRGFQPIFNTSSLDGINGSDGVAGADGATGAEGATGADGATGMIGADGVTGADGATGLTGAEGATGANGLTGANGANGATGVDGATGETGATGISGTDGVTGDIGATGSTGADGATGMIGANGATGADGATGANGTFNIAGCSAEVSTSPGTDPLGYESISARCATAGDFMIHWGWTSNLIRNNTNAPILTHAETLFTSGVADGMDISVYNAFGLSSHTTTLTLVCCTP